MLNLGFTLVTTDTTKFYSLKTKMLLTFST